jgi:hypothetical protein
MAGKKGNGESETAGLLRDLLVEMRGMREAIGRLEQEQVRTREELRSAIAELRQGLSVVWNAHERRIVQLERKVGGRK